MSTDKTLAGVQPGGRVRLGDQAELDRLEFQAWARELLPCPFCGNSAEFVPYKDNGLTLKCKSMGCIQRNQRTLRYGIDWLRTSMAEHWNTRALSAQPSPGGQDALPPMPACRDRQPDDMPGYMESALDWVRDVDNCDAVDWLIDNHAAIRAALAAQFSPGETLPPEMRLGSPDYLDYLDAEPSPGGQGDALNDLQRYSPDPENTEYGWMQGMMEDTAMGEWVHIEDVRALAARQPVGEPITVEAVATVGRNSDGDRHIDWLTEGGISNLEVGDVLMVSDRAITDENGSGEVYAALPAQGVDLGPVRDVFRRWHENELNSTDAMLALVEALAVVDSQAVGNG